MVAATGGTGWRGCSMTPAPGTLTFRGRFLSLYSSSCDALRSSWLLALWLLALWPATHADVRARSSAASNFASQEGDLDAPRMRSIGAVMNEKSAITTWNSVVRAMTSRFSHHHGINGVYDSTFTTHIQQEVERATSDDNRTGDRAGVHAEDHRGWQRAAYSPERRP